MAAILTREGVQLIYDSVDDYVYVLLGPVVPIIPTKEFIGVYELLQKLCTGMYPNTSNLCWPHLKLVISSNSLNIHSVSKI
jgi:hypothetical protein